MVQKRYRFTLIAVITGLVLFSSAFMLDRVVKRKIGEEMKQKLPLINGSESYSKWSSPSVPIYLKFHFFNVSNPDEILEGKKAKLNEIGPFVYQEIVSRDVIGFEDNEQHLRFKTRKSYRFIPEQSILSLDTPLTTINLPLVVSFTCDDN